MRLLRSKISSIKTYTFLDCQGDAFYILYVNAIGLDGAVDWIRKNSSGRRFLFCGTRKFDHNDLINIFNYTPVPWNDSGNVRQIFEAHCDANEMGSVYFTSHILTENLDWRTTIPEVTKKIRRRRTQK